MKTWSNTGFSPTPYMPDGPPTPVDGLSLSEIRDTMTRMAPDPVIEARARAIVERWVDNRDTATPLQDLLGLIEALRKMPRGPERMRAMNTVVRTLGRADVLANVLDMLRDSAMRDGSTEAELSMNSRGGEMHCLYGWCGQTVLLHSLSEPTEGTLGTTGEIREALGYPPATWGFAIHIWQPNPKARGFACSKRPEPGRLVEPPHSHPFDFASMLAIGTMHQSTYRQCSVDEVEPGGRYEGTRLDHVDGVWPPHAHREPMGLTTVEDRVAFTAGDSYFMPCDVVHDVEVEERAAKTTPAVTLFLCSEAVVLPHCYMTPPLADYHAEHPNIKDAAKALPYEDWQAKLQAVSAYLRGESSTLSLDDIVKYDGEYAFFHRDS